ncbi:MAG: LabA-like NYN domain-containing protein [Candidatus Aquicultor sp.]
MDRVIIFIDGSNFYHSIKGYCGKSDSKLDYRELSKKIAGDGRKFIKTYYYRAPVVDDGTEKAKTMATGQQRLFSKLRQTEGVEVCLGRMYKQDDTYIEKGVDIKIAIDMLTKAFNDEYDVAVLISADSDFEEVVKAVRGLGKRVELGTFTNRKAFHLGQACNKLLMLDKFIDELLP